MKVTRKIIAAALCLIMLTSGMPVASFAAEYAPENGEFVFTDESVFSYLENPDCITVEYDSSVNAMKITVTDSYDPKVLLNMSSLRLKAADYNSLLVIFRVPTSASALANKTELFISAGAVTGPAAGKSTIYGITKSNTYTSQIIDLSALSWWNGDIHSIRIDPFTSSKVGDTMYIDSIILCDDYNDAINTRDARLAEIYGMYGDDYSNTDYVCTSYEYDKYTSPFWKGNIVYNEAVYPVKDKNGNAVYTLMYTPDEITSVYSSDFSSRYYDGIDYIVNGNEITFLTSGSIKFKDYNYIHPQSNPNNYDGGIYYNRTAAGDGKWEYWGQSPEFYNGYINVTYTHSDTWDHYVPEQKSDEIPLTSHKIENKQAMNIVFYGDSICGGANSSSYRNVYPYAEYWNEMIVSKLRYDLGMRINATYSSVGGSTATDMVQHVDTEVTSKAPDLVFIEFGANDAMNESQSSSGSASRLKSNYKNAVVSMINEVRDTYPNCEFVLVAPFYCNPHCHYMSYFEACRDALNEIASAYSGVTVADVTAMQASLLEFKDYLDFSGDNMCHPNDYMARFYAQICLETIVPGGIAPYTVSEEPPVTEPDVGNETSAAPESYGWQWGAAEAYGYIGNYGTNGQDIEFTVDLSLISSITENATAHFYTAEGGNIIISPTGVQLGGRTFAYNWGKADISNWHTVKITIKNGAAAVYIDGAPVASVLSGIKALTDYQLFFSYTACMAIDNMNLSTSGGKVYLDCDFENATEAQTIMGEGLGNRTLLAANTVSYNMNGGDGTIKNQIKVRGTSLTLSDTVPTREGYTFIGWATDPSAVTAEYERGAIYTDETSATLYAVWEKETESEPEYMMGDINCNGKLEAADSNLMKRLISGTMDLTEQLVIIADMNADGKFNSVDSYHLAKKLLGQVS